MAEDSTANGDHWIPGDAAHYDWYHTDISDDDRYVPGPKVCAPPPCPPFLDVTLELARCPTCGSAQLKWHFTQRFECSDPFHDGGVANPNRLRRD